MSEEKKSFTVRDRRHFTAEGLAREEAPPEPVAATRPSPGVGHGPREAPAAKDRSPGLEPAADFAGFLLSMAAQASLALGAEEGGGAPDLSEARHFIALFEMLRDKTEGRRTPEEDRILQGILYELRMAYLARARSVGA